MVKIVNNATDFDRELEQAGGKLVVVDFYADWCGPCRMVAPHIERMASTYTNVVFLKVNVDEADDIAAKYQVRAMPTFLFFQDRNKIESVVGADVNKIEGIIRRYNKPAPSAFSGTGHTLGGGSSGGRPAQPQQPTPQPQQPSGVPEEVKEMFISEMVDMGFPRELASLALKNSGGKSVADAVEWILANEDAAAQLQEQEQEQEQEHEQEQKHEQEPKEEREESNPQPEKGKGEATTEEPQEKKEEEEEKLVLTPEELKEKEEEKRKKAHDLQAQIRRKQAEEEKKRDLEREKERMKSGKELTKAKEEIAEMQRKKDIEERLRQRKETKRAKQKILEQIEKDKEERRAEKAQEKEEQQQEQKSAPIPQQVTEKQYDKCEIQIRLPGGRVMRGTFKPDDLLQEVFVWVLTNRNDGVDEFQLLRPFPREVFSGEKLGTTLKDAGLVPRGQLIAQNS